MIYCTTKDSIIILLHTYHIYIYIYFKIAFKVDLRVVTSIYVVTSSCVRWGFPLSLSISNCRHGFSLGWKRHGPKILIARETNTANSIKCNEVFGSTVFLVLRLCSVHLVALKGWSYNLFQVPTLFIFCYLDAWTSEKG